MRHLPLMILAALGSVGGLTAAEPARLRIDPAPLHAIDGRLFGQILERANWAGELGAESVFLPGTRTRQTGLDDLLRTMRIPLVRFPGGSHVDYLDWTDLIDHVPGRPGPRPDMQGEMTVTSRFGFEEYFDLQRAMGWDSIIVVNLLDALTRKRPLADATQHAAGLVAYCNAPQGAKLPAGMPDWPAIRALNGHPAPHGVRYFQIGNEWFAGFREKVEKDLGTTDTAAVAARFTEVVQAYVRAMFAVDPTIEFIIDAEFGGPVADLVLADTYLRAHVRHVAVHHYYPMGVKRFVRGDTEVDPATVTPEEAWYAYLSPQTGWVDGHDGPKRARRFGYRVAFTEWNWNAWSGLPDDAAPPGFEGVSGVGAAEMLHAIFRAGVLADIAIQSALVGTSWKIMAVRVSPDGSVPPHCGPQAAVTTLYNQWHGDRRLAAALTGGPTYTQVVRINRQPATGPLPALDAVVTASDTRIFIHVLNRHWKESAPLSITFAGKPPASAGTIHTLDFAGRPDWGPGSLSETSRAVPTQTDGWSVELPPASVSVIVLPRP